MKIVNGKIKFKNGYDIVMDNSIARSFNVNIDSPSFFCFAYTKREAISKMKESDFSYKGKTISRVYITKYHDNA